MLIYKKIRLISFEIIKFAISALFSGPPGIHHGRSAHHGLSFRITVVRGTTVTEFSCRSFLSATTNQTSLAFNRKFTKIPRESRPHVLNMLEQAFKIPGRTNLWFWAQTKQLEHLSAFPVAFWGSTVPFARLVRTRFLSRCRNLWLYKFVSKLPISISAAIDVTPLPSCHL